MVKSAEKWKGQYNMFRHPEWRPDYCSGGAGEEGGSWDQCGRSQESMHDIVGLEMSYLLFKQCSHFQVKQLRGLREGFLTRALSLFLAEIAIFLVITAASFCGELESLSSQPN